MEIISGLYLGSCHASYNKDALSRLNVKYIVNCSGQDNFYGDEFTYLHVYLKDREDYDILSSFYYSIDFISEGLQKGSVFVYCTRGRCRSVSTVAGFLMSHCHMSFSDALCLLREKRPQMRINDAFLKQLRCFFECDCSIRLAYQLYLANVLTHYSAKFRRRTDFLRILQLYKTLTPASVVLCRPFRECCGLPLPRFISQQYRCKYCQKSLFRSHNLLDHQRVNLHDLSIGEGHRTIRCSSEYIGGTATFVQQHHISFADYVPLSDDDRSSLPYVHDTFSPATSPLGQNSSQSSAIPPLRLSSDSGENMSMPSTSKHAEEWSGRVIATRPHAYHNSQDAADLVSCEALVDSGQTVSTPLFHSLSFLAGGMSVQPSSLVDLCAGTESVDSDFSASDASTALTTDKDFAHKELGLVDSDKSDSSEAVEFISREKRGPSIFDDIDDIDDKMLDSQIFSMNCSAQVVSTTDNCSSPLGVDEALLKNLNASLENVERATLIEHVPLENCSDYFIEPLDWVVQQVADSECDKGILHCPNPECLHELGGFGLTSKHQCKCGFSTSTYFYVKRECIE